MFNCNIQRYSGVLKGDAAGAALTLITLSAFQKNLFIAVKLDFVFVTVSLWSIAHVSIDE